MIEPRHFQQSEQRFRRDRRMKPTPAVGVYWLRGRRRSARREADIGSGYYVDHPGNAALAAVGVLMVLGILDAALTLQLMDRGAIEANPVMAFFLSLGVTAFLGVKLALTATAPVVLLLHTNFALGHPRLQVKWVIALLLSVYAALVTYEVTLFGHDPQGGIRPAIELGARTGGASFRGFS